MRPVPGGPVGGTRPGLLLVAAVSVAFVITLSASSLKNTVQVFFLPMADSLDETRGAFALTTTLFAVTFAVAAPVTGVLADRFGPSAVLRAGVVVAGVSLAGCSVAPSLPVFVAFYGAGAACAYAMLSYVPLGVLVDRLFPEGRKGIFYALLTNGTAAGFLLLVPLWGWVSEWTSWRAVLMAVSVVFLVVLAPLSMVMSRQEERPRPAAAVSPADRWSGLRSRTFWVLALSFFSCGFTMAFVDVHLVAHLHDHHVSMGITSASVALLGAAEIVGSLLAGAWCDRGLVKRVLVAGYLLRGSSLLLLTLAPGSVHVLAFGAVFGFSFLMTVVATSMWILRAFPHGSKGTLMGCVWAVHQLGAATSSQAGAALRDSTGSYSATIWAAAGCALVSLVLVAGLPGPAAPAPASRPGGGEAEDNTRGAHTTVDPEAELVPGVSE